MPPIVYGNRGRPLERKIRELFKHYQARGIPCQQNHPRTIMKKGLATPIEKHGFDFQLLYKGMFWAFDAKLCKSVLWPTSNAKPHQRAELLRISEQGGQGFFLVYFALHRKLIRFDVPLSNKKSLSPDDGTTIPLDFLEILECPNTMLSKQSRRNSTALPSPTDTSDSP